MRTRGLLLWQNSPSQWAAVVFCCRFAGLFAYPENPVGTLYLCYYLDLIDFFFSFSPSQLALLFCSNDVFRLELCLSMLLVALCFACTVLYFLVMLLWKVTLVCLVQCSRSQPCQTRRAWWVSASHSPNSCGRPRRWVGKRACQEGNTTQPLKQLIMWDEEG